MNNHIDYTGMNAISLWNPWPWLIVRGHKSIETRSWAPPEALIGQRIAIHAGKKLAPWPVLRHVEALAARRGFDMPEFELLDTGALVGTVELSEVREYPDAQSFFKDGLGHLCTDPEVFAVTRYGWVFKYPELEESPIPLRGLQGFFNVNIPLADRARAEGVIPPWPDPVPGISKNVAMCTDCGFILGSKACMSCDFFQSEPSGGHLNDSGR